MKKSLVWFSFLGLVITCQAFAGGDPNYVLKVDDPSPNPCFPGSDATVRTLLDFANGSAVSGVSYGVCHDPAVVGINCTGGIPNDCIDNGLIVQGAELLATNGGGGAGFFAPATATMPSDGYTCGIVINLLGGDSLPPAADAELVVATYRCLAEGTSPLTICETGSPLVLLSVGIAGGGDVIPETQDNSIEVVPVTFYTVRQAQGQDTRVDVFGGQTTGISTWLDFNQDPLAPDASGVSYGICHDAELLSINCVGGLPNDCIDNSIIVQGAELQATNGGDGAGFFAPATATSPLVGYTCGIVINLLGGDVLPNTGSAQLAVTQYRAVEVDNDTETILEVCETGEPLVLLSVGIAGGGDEIPNTNDGLLNILSAAKPTFAFAAPGTEEDPVQLVTSPEGEGSVDISISLVQDGQGTPGGPDPVMDAPIAQTQGFSFGLSHTGDVSVADAGNPPASDRGIRPAAALMALNGGSGPEFFGPNSDAAGGPGITVGVVYNLLGGEEIDFENDTPVIDVTYDANLDPEQIGGDPIPVPLVFATADAPLGDPPVIPGVVVSGSLDDPPLSFINGQLLIVFDNAFVRGDCNDDGIVNIADGIWILNELFQDGPAGGCREACDSNRDGTFDSSDAIFVFNYQFLDGPPPSAPFPDCDTQPGADCETANACN